MQPQSQGTFHRCVSTQGSLQLAASHHPLSDCFDAISEVLKLQLSYTFSLILEWVGTAEVLLELFLIWGCTVIFYKTPSDSWWGSCILSYTMLSQKANNVWCRKRVQVFELSSKLRSAHLKIQKTKSKLNDMSTTPTNANLTSTQCVICVKWELTYFQF